MARRKKSFSANKGKFIETYLNNYLVDSEKERKKREKEREKERKARGRDKEKERKQRERSLERERARKEKERVRNDKIRIKEYQKLQTYKARAKLDCEKYGISVLVADEIAVKAMAHGYTRAQIAKNLIKGKEKDWQKRRDEIVEEDYLDCLNGFCQDVLVRRDEYHVFGIWDEEFIAAMMDERPASDNKHHGTLNQFNKSSQVYIHYLERTNNLRAVDHWGKEQKKTRSC